MSGNKRMNKWDEKAKNYARYQEGEDRFEAKVLEAVEDFGITFKDKTLIDIGCGSGVYTLRVAQSAKRVEALDFSKEMIKILKKDAKKLSLSNINYIVSTWSEYKPKEIFDIALCTMSPAIKHEPELEKMHKYAKTKIYLGWFGQRDSHILDTIFKAHGKTYTPPNGAQRVEEWLIKNKIPYQDKIFSELKEKRREFEKAVENFSWHLEVRKAVPNEKIIRDTLKDFIDDKGCIKESIINQMKLLIWE